ncbi:MAG: outer membrane protein assembly factor BamB family protein [Thermoleophilia bacterium]
MRIAYNRKLLFFMVISVAAAAASSLIYLTVRHSHISNPELSSSGSMFGADLGRSSAYDSAALPGPPHIKWSLQGFLATTAPVVSEDTVFVGGITTSGRREYGIHAVGFNTGQEKWVFKIGNDMDPLESTPAIAGGIVYFCGDRSLFALDAQTGEKRWQYQVSHRTTDSPVVARGFVYFSSGDRLIALDALTGEEKWSVDTQSAFLASESVNDGSSVADGTVYFTITHHTETHDSGSIHAVDAKSGVEKWNYEPQGGVGGARIEGSPIATGGLVLFWDAGNNVHCLDASNGEERWNTKTAGKVKLPLAIWDNKVFVGEISTDQRGEAGRIKALDIDSGEEKWSFDAGKIRIAPAIVDGQLYFGDDRTTSSPIRSKLYNLDAKTGKLLWTSDALWTPAEPGTVQAGSDTFTFTAGRLLIDAKVYQ